MASSSPLTKAKAVGRKQAGALSSITSIRSAREAIATLSVALQHSYLMWSYVIRGDQAPLAQLCPNLHHTTLSHTSRLLEAIRINEF